MQGFKNFLMRGNVIELAVAVVVGAAFTAIVGAFTEAIISPLIAMAFDAEELSRAKVGPFPIGVLIAAIINFFIVAAIVYFVLVLPMAKLREHHERRRGVEPEAPAETDLDILRDIRELLQAQQQAHAAPPADAPGTPPRA